MKYSKLVSLATAGYGAYCVAKPRHLADALEVPSEQAPAVDRLAYTYAGRDIPLGTAALLSRNPTVVTTAMVLRILSDLSDATVLGTSTSSKPQVQRKVLAITLGYAALNVAALVADRRAARN